MSKRGFISKNKVKWGSFFLDCFVVPPRNDDAFGVVKGGVAAVIASETQWSEAIQAFDISTNRYQI